MLLSRHGGIAVDEVHFEQAARLAQMELDAALHRHRARPAVTSLPMETCSECGDDIPLARRQAINTHLCVHCQAAQEHKLKTLGAA
ncbi:MAG: TraR/DksA C4-type zinc finger protein [Pseudomonadales bacterium]|nr:TraR/DksA C4-type zinc finger protein [Pseudomonadales bacterium]